MRIVLFLFFVIIFTTPIFSQQIGSWKKTSFNPSPASRLNDGFFISPSLGWAVNGAGQIHRTLNGGESWQKVFEKSGTHFRSVAFFDSLNGFAGCLGWGDVNNPSSTDTNILYRTNDGGSTWSPVIALSSSIIKRGFCGAKIVNDSVMVAVGRVRGPGWFYKTTDRGNTWIAKDLSHLAPGLIDVYFFTPDSGFIVGLTHTTHDSSSGIILFTSDGGNSWSEVHRSTRKGEWCWKIVWPSRTTGYVSLQRNSKTPIYFLKTTNGGANWEEKLFSNNYYFVQGIGFINDSLGWIGGYSSQPMYQTTDGGETWKPLGLGRRINRFRVINNSLVFAFGDSIYKYTSTPTYAELENNLLHEYHLEDPYPNPANPQANITFSLSTPSHVRLFVYNTNGELIRVLIDSWKNTGTYTISWDGTNEAEETMPTGIYLLKIVTESWTESKKLILLR